MYKYLNLPTNKLPTHLIEVRNEFKDKNGQRNSSKKKKL